MKRRSTVSLITSVAFCLCTTGSTKSTLAFDISNSTGDSSLNKNGTEMSAHQESHVLIAPPQPKNRQGKFVCTHNRYVPGEQQIGVASWYGAELHGSVTKSGERFNKNASTIAHLTLPMGTGVLIKNPVTGGTVYATVNDCGPYVAGRIVDLSEYVAHVLGIKKRGTGIVVLTVL